MNANLAIHNTRVQLDDASLEKLNAALLDCPVLKETYNRETEKYDHIVQPNLRIQLKPVFELKAETVTVK